MKTHTLDFKNVLPVLGRMQSAKITFNDTVLDEENINQIQYGYNGNILKSVMKYLEIDSNVEIEKDTELNYKWGLYINDEVEYLDYGNFIVYSCERKEDTNSYNIKCYDKMLYTMKDYEKLDVNYPCTIRDYIKALCNKLNLQFKNSNDEFANYNRVVNGDLFDGLGYTYRDVLDQLSEVTASSICITLDDRVEIRYPNETNDTINEEYLKNVNVNFGEMYENINVISLTRSGGSDTIYFPENLPGEINEVKIEDNQFMNFNDRVDYLPAIYDKLSQLAYSINDYSSIGVMYYDYLDYYNIRIGDNVYKCLMLNDEQNITQGIEENIYSEKPEKTETDYKKADTTDRRINQTYIIVDKQNQQIESVVNETTKQNDKIARMQQTVDKISSSISDIADITTSKENMQGKLEFEKINQSEPIHIEIRPLGENISYLYPSNLLYPSNNLYIKLRVLRFTNTETNEIVNYELPNDLLYYDENNYDEFILDYESKTCYVNKKCTYNENGVVVLLENSTVLEYEYPKILLDDGNYKIEVLKYDNTPYICYLFVRLMTQNIYTTQFATKAEVSSNIEQTAHEINLNVNKKLEDYSTTTEMNSAISVKANEINSVVLKKVGENEIISKINQSAEAVGINANKIDLSANNILNLISGNEINLSSKNIKISSNNFNVDANGNMNCKNANIVGNITSNNAKITGGYLDLNASNGQQVIRVIENQNTSTMSYITTNVLGINRNGCHVECAAFNNEASIDIYQEGGNETYISNNGIRTPSLTQTSLESQKKNFEKLENALNIIKNVDIYKYNLKSQKDGEKKHIGFVIGDNFNYSEELTSIKNDGVDIYSLASCCLQAIKEQQEEIERLKNEINKLKGGNL